MMAMKETMMIVVVLRKRREPSILFKRVFSVRKVMLDIVNQRRDLRMGQGLLNFDWRVSVKQDAFCFVAEYFSCYFYAYFLYKVRFFICIGSLYSTFGALLQSKMLFILISHFVTK